ncbi:MAG: methionine--tRNA ligase subunit beta, partial [Deltaproteobacteria bacterium]|nr:methionine--tRNA ligase subunit beta [Deltaproteobacteria bacterium]
GLPSGNTVTRGDSLFPRVEYKGEEKKAELSDMKPEIGFQEFGKIDLRVALILEAESVPKSEKLIKLKIDIGEERTIVAGIGKDYKPEDLPGKKIAVLVNLKPAKLMGVTSQGMLLATDMEKGLTLLSFDGDAKVGAKIK